MSALFVALGIMVLALLALLLWFVPHLLQQQATRVAGETTQLREMLLDLLNEQEAVTIRQGQLNASLSNLQDQLTDIASAGNRAQLVDQQTALIAENGMQQLEARLGELQSQIKEWADGRQQGARQRAAQDNEAWANLMGLLASIQERVGTLSQDRASVMAGLQAGVLLEELEQEMQNLRSISEEIEMLQWRLRRSLHERESNLSVLRTRTSNGA
jgi:cell division protein ZapA (FtsZ GTPase activity inhibitor)